MVAEFGMQNAEDARPKVRWFASGECKMGCLHVDASLRFSIVATN
jgi:hypothetical protein